MSSDVIVTIEGWVGSDPQSYTAGETTLTKFRLGHTPRYKSRHTGEWTDGETQWFTVSAWRQLGAHCLRSVHKGDPVIVRGRLSQRTWQTKTGDDVVSLELDAISVGHNLAMGTAAFTRSMGQVRSAPAAGPTAAAGEDERTAAVEQAKEDWPAA